LKVISGAPHGMVSTLKNQSNAELLAFFKQSQGGRRLSVGLAVPILPKRGYGKTT